MAAWFFAQAARARQAFERGRVRRRWERLRQMGMHIGDSVFLPGSTWVDSTHCFLISIGDNCGFGPHCFLLAHDAQMEEFIDAARVGRITIHESCHIGAYSVILPGVEIGPRTIVGAHSVVSKSLPSNTVCAGNPAKVICSLDEYLDKHRRRLETRPTFDFARYNVDVLPAERRSELIRAVSDGDAYIVGGHSAELQGRGTTERT
jgi:maltose O-acetyltransferase